MIHRPLNIVFKRLTPDAKKPTKGSENAAGWDLYATNLSRQTGGILYHTGLAIQIPEGYFGAIFPRSSIVKTSMRLANSVGVIDSDYRGEITFYFDTDVKNPDLLYKPGDRIGQLIILPRYDIEWTESMMLTPTERGEGGYGSSGK